MTNTYIQDKLDEFDEIVELTIELIEGGAVLNKNDLKMALKEKTKKLFTDYHNHIVEKINSIDPTKSNNAIDHHIKIKSLLQDTNPKE